MESALTNAASQTNFTPIDWVIVVAVSYTHLTLPTICSV